MNDTVLRALDEMARRQIDMLAALHAHRHLLVRCLDRDSLLAGCGELAALADMAEKEEMTDVALIRMTAYRAELDAIVEQASVRDNAPPQS